MSARGSKLDAVIELKVDEACARASACENRVRTRPIAAGGTVRSDDNPEAFQESGWSNIAKRRRPFPQHYAATGQFKTVDGMADVEIVTDEIEKILACGLEPKALKKEPAGS